MHVNVAGAAAGPGYPPSDPITDMTARPTLVRGARPASAATAAGAVADAGRGTSLRIRVDVMSSCRWAPREIAGGTPTARLSRSGSHPEPHCLRAPALAADRAVRRLDFGFVPIDTCLGLALGLSAPLLGGSFGRQ